MSNSYGQWGTVLLGAAYGRGIFSSPDGTSINALFGEFSKGSKAQESSATLSFLPYEGGSLERFPVHLAPIDPEPLFAELTSLPQRPPPAHVTFEPAIKDWHHASVAAIRAAIAAGDVYQACLTMQVAVPGDGAALFARLHPDGVLLPWSAWVRFPDGRELVSASPECFFRVENGLISAEPMKGTARLEEEKRLRESPKDRAELAMITDLLRNDLTPLCVPKTVRVVEAQRLVRLRYALQMVAEIEGKLRESVTLPEILAALHPGGSVVGAPKNAAYTLLQQLETTPRGAYCGTLGLASLDEKTHNHALLIRTGFRRSSSNPFAFGVGSGIVWGSNAAAEWDEWEIKLGALC